MTITTSSSIHTTSCSGGSRDERGKPWVSLTPATTAATITSASSHNGSGDAGGVVSLPGGQLLPQLIHVLLQLVLDV